MRRRRLFWPVLALLYLGCALIRPESATESFGRDFIGFLEAHDSARVSAVLDPSLTTYTAWGQIVELADSLSAFHRDSTSLIGWNIVKSPDDYRANLTYEIHGQGWAVVNVSMIRRQGTLVANGVHFTRTSDSQSALNSFRLAGHGWRHYAVLVMAISCLLFCLTTAVIIARSAMPRRWLWAFVALIGYGQAGINWATGETFLNPLRFQLFCAAYFRPGVVGPWLVSFALPLGAVMALWRKHTLTRDAAVPRVPTAAA